MKKLDGKNDNIDTLSTNHDKTINPCSAGTSIRKIISSQKGFTLLYAYIACSSCLKHYKWVVSFLVLHNVFLKSSDRAQEKNHHSPYSIPRHMLRTKSHDK